MNIDLISGASAGLVTTMLLHPLDLIKTRFQAHGRPGSTLDPIDAHARHLRYTTIRGAVRSIWLEGGVRAFYNGVVPALIGSGASWGFYFYFYEATKRYIVRSHGDSAYKIKAWEHMWAAMFSGAITCLFTNPIWLIKTRMQLQQANVKGLSSTAHSISPYKGTYDAFRSIVREEGLRGLYRGLVPALFLTSHGAVQFSIYEDLKRRFPPNSDNPSSRLFLYGAVSKLAATTVTYPYQVLKTRIQQRAANPREHQYKGFFQAIGKVWRGEGIPGFYRGFITNVLRVAPQSAVTLVAYENIHALLTKITKE